VNIEPAGFSVNLDELGKLAAKAGDHAENLRQSWRQDWFEDDKWPETDQLRQAVIIYRKSLQAAMERLGMGADEMATHLRHTAEHYRGSDTSAAWRFVRLAQDVDVRRDDGRADA
jgi:hypothetical protein